MPIIRLALRRIIENFIRKIESLNQPFGNLVDPFTVFQVGFFWLRGILLLDPGNEVRMVHMVAAHDFYVMRAHIFPGGIVGQIQRGV